MIDTSRYPYFGWGVRGTHPVVIGCRDALISAGVIDYTDMFGFNDEEVITLYHKVFGAAPSDTRHQ